jgi:hypothetical protein
MSRLFRFEAIEHKNFDEAALEYSKNNDPVGLLKNCRKRGGELEAGTRRLQWQFLATCYAGAYGIRQQPKLFLKLMEDEYFDQRSYKASSNDLLRISFLIGTDAHAKGPTYKKACSIASRLQPLFDAEVEPMEVLKRIEAAGGLKRLNVSDLVTEASEADDEGLTDDADDVGPGDDDDDEAADYVADPGDDQENSDEKQAACLTTMRVPARSKPSERRTMPSGSTKARGGQARVKQATAQSKQVIKTPQNVVQEPGDGMVILEVEVTPEMLSRVLSSGLSFLCVKCTESKKGWYTVVCSRVNSLD